MIDQVDATRDDDHDGPDSVLAGLSVELTFSAGRVTLSLDDLRRLAQGRSVDLHRPADASVEIAANGRSIGRGELVDIDGRLAVEVLELWPAR